MERTCTLDSMGNGGMIQSCMLVNRYSYFQTLNCAKNFTSATLRQPQVLAWHIVDFKPSIT